VFGPACRVSLAHKCCVRRFKTAVVGFSFGFDCLRIETLQHLGFIISLDYQNHSRTPNPIRRLDPQSAAELESTWKAKAERKDAIAAEVLDTLKVFYCEACRKQYKTVSEFDNHQSSYDHHHTIRLKDLKDREKRQKQSRSGDGKKRDRREAERELERISRMASSKADAQAGGLSAPASEAALSQPPPPPRPVAPSMRPATTTGATVGGWSSLSATTADKSPFQPERSPAPSGGWTQAAAAPGGGWTQAAAPSDDDADASAAALKQEERRRKLEAWKAAQNGGAAAQPTAPSNVALRGAQGASKPATASNAYGFALSAPSGGGSGAPAVHQGASKTPIMPSSAFGFGQRGMPQQTSRDATAGSVAASRTGGVFAPPKRKTVMAAFGGSSDEDDDAAEQAPQQKKHRALWQPTWW
jgi:hypothetical protein